MATWQATRLFREIRHSIRFVSVCCKDKQTWKLSDIGKLNGKSTKRVIQINTLLGWSYGPNTVRTQDWSKTLVIVWDDEPWLLLLNSMAHIDDYGSSQSTDDN